jgi:cytochrome c oxidase assembly protein subunit 15
MHIAHRLGAVVTFVFLAWLSLRLYLAAASRYVRRWSVVLISVVGIQVLLGVSNIVFMLPLGVAVAHNGVAACLLLVMVNINYTLWRKL